MSFAIESGWPLELESGVTPASISSTVDRGLLIGGNLNNNQPDHRTLPQRLNASKAVAVE